MKMKGMRNCSHDIAKNTLKKLKVMLKWMMHELTHVINYEGDIRSGDSEILEGTSQTVISDWVEKWLQVSRGRC